MKRLPTKCLIVSFVGKIKTWEEARAANHHVQVMLMEYAREVCDAYNIATDGISINYIRIGGGSMRPDEEMVVEALAVMDVDDWTPAARDFIECGLLTARAGHVDVTAGITINFNVAFLSAGSIIITREAFSS